MTQTIIQNGLVFYKGRFNQLNILIEDGLIKEIDSDSIGSTDNETEVIDANGQYVIPGFIDLHTHGGYGVDINNASAEKLAFLAEQFATVGTTSFLLSIVTDTVDNTKRIIQQYNEIKNQLSEKSASILGLHLEGPFLAADYKGSMPEHLLIPYNQALLEEYQALAENQIRYITVAPEVEGVLENIPQMKALGIQVSMGHTGASYETASQAINKGAEVCTHTFNAMKLFHQHDPSIFAAVMEDDTVFCELICDGRHVHPGGVRMLMAIKGKAKIVGITDSIMAAGLADGNYRLGVNDITVKDGDAKLSNADVRAGSTLTMINALKNLMDFTGQPLEEIVPILTENPAKVLGMTDEIGVIEVGRRADLNILSKDYDIVETLLAGRLLYHAKQVK